MKLLFLFSPEMNRQPKTNANPYKNSHPIYDVIKKALKYFWIFQKKNEEKKIYMKNRCVSKNPKWFRCRLKFINIIYILF